MTLKKNNKKNKLATPYMISKCATHVYRKAHVGVRYILEHFFLEQMAVRTFLLDILSFRRITFRN